MPILDGYQATAAIREWENANYKHNNHVPIVALTGKWAW